MSVFFLVFFAVYGGLHTYAFLRARSALAFSPAAGAGLAAFMLVMVLAPLLIRVFERHGYELAARVLSYIGYLWMAGLFLFFCSSLALEAYNFAVRAGGWAGGAHADGFLLSSRTSFLIAAGLSVVLCVYGYFSALHYRTERVVIRTAKLPAGRDRLRIVQISDVHLGMIVRQDRLRRILRIVEAEHPDILVSTGDLVDAQINHMTGMAGLLREVQAPLGKFAITGNHEFYAGIDQALAFTRDAGFRILRGETADAGGIVIAGVDDPAETQLGLGKPVSEELLLSGTAPGRFKLLLKHRPSAAAESAGLFDLQLSGHTHRGQIYPFRYLVELAYPKIAGTYDLAGGSVLHVSRGTGTWGPPVRVLSPPEITVIDIVRDAP